MQTDACPYPTVLRIEPVEQIRQILRLYTGTIIFYLQRHPFLRFFHNHPNRSTLRCELESIR